MCGGTTGGLSTEGIDLTKEAVIEGVVRRDGEPVGGAYVRLHDAAGEFTAEVPTSATGAFRFFASPGTWLVRVLAPGRPEPAERRVVARQGAVASVEVSV
ncbi:MAG TPA: DUF1416 domain-containing protein [Mycobacteriales bacterium]|nr:DUF1416 domain-containing protein [Mycobacteriales bacterium]